MPDSLLTAAKTLADALSVPWPRVNAVYRELQDAEELPRSTGRRIWYASPQLAARLLIGVTGDLVMIGATAACQGYRGAVSDAGKTLEEALASELVAGGDSVRFSLDGTGRNAYIGQGSGPIARFTPALEFQGDLVGRQPHVILSATVDVRAFEHMRAAVAWRLDSEAPYGPPSSLEARG